MIQAYPARPSVRAGERLRLHVSTNAAAFRVEFYRQGVTLDLRACSECRRGRYCPPGRYDHPWGWPAEDFDVPEDWSPGVYLALLIEVDGTGADLSRPEVVFDERDSRALFVVRPRSAALGGSTTLYKLAWATYHAYNASGGGSLYHNGGWLPSDAPSHVTTMRPGGGTGGALSFPNDSDVYDPASPREGFAHWDAPMIAWLERRSHQVDYCTDLDIQLEPGMLEPYRLLLSVGHDEYWSAEVRSAVQRFASGGGNVAFFGGNTCWWRVTFDDDGDRMSCLHPPVSAERSDQWWRIEPENTLTGVSYRNGGGWWKGAREALGFTVQHSGHWIFEGTGLRDGDTFGAAERLVGYECDGAALVCSHDGLLLPDGSDGTPADFTVLGHARLGPGWQDRPRGADAAATMGVHTPGGTVFTAATTDWSRLLASGDAVVERVTSNVLRRLTAPTLRIRGPAGQTGASDDAVSRAGSAAAGTAVTFHVPEPDVPTIRYRWRCAVGGAAAHELDARNACVTVKMPLEPALVTVTVEGDIESGSSAFGSRTVRVLSEREASQVALLWELRSLVMDAVPALSPTRPLGDGNRPFGDPDWDVLRDGLRTMMDRDTARAVAASAERLLAVIQPLTA